MSYRIRYWIEIGEFIPDKKEFIEVAPDVEVSSTDMGYSDNLVVVSVIEDSYLVFTTAKNQTGHDLILQDAVVAIQHQLGCCSCDSCNDD